MLPKVLNMFLLSLIYALLPLNIFLKNTRWIRELSMTIGYYPGYKKYWFLVWLKIPLLIRNVKYFQKE